LKIALYARVSKAADQTAENQILKLQEWAKTAEFNGQKVEPGGVFIDEISSRKTRPQKEAILGLLRTGELQGVVFVRLDRWARSVGEFAKELTEASDKGWVFVDLGTRLAFDNAFGRAHAQIIMVMAELERELIRERTKDGLERAKAQGKRLGRHPRNCDCPRHKVA
jgi:DNA invertase Pin-like site-specific DNA recombinase